MNLQEASASGIYQNRIEAENAFDALMNGYTQAIWEGEMQTWGAREVEASPRG